MLRPYWAASTPRVDPMSSRAVARWRPFFFSSFDLIFRPTRFIVLPQCEFATVLRLAAPSGQPKRQHSRLVVCSVIDLACGCKSDCDRLAVILWATDRSEYVVSTLRDLETNALAEKATVAKLIEEAQEPVKLPSIDEITRLAFNLEKTLNVDPQAGREQLIRWLKDGCLRVSIGWTATNTRRALCSPS